MVWQSKAGAPLCVEKKKVAPRFFGPFPINNVVNLCGCKIESPLSESILHSIKMGVKMCFMLLLPSAAYSALEKIDED